MIQPTQTTQQPGSPSGGMKPTKMTPQELQQFRGQNVSYETIARAMAERNPSFKAKLADPIDGIYDPSGKPMNWNEVAVNMEVYGNPYGENAPTGPATTKKDEASNPYFGGGIFDKTLGALSGAIQVSVAKGASALGYDRLERGMNSPGGSVDVRQLPQNAKTASDTLTTVGAVAGSVAGPLGTGAGAFAGKAVGNLVETVANSQAGAEQKTPGQLITEPVKEGVIGAAVDGAFLGAGKIVGKVGAPLIATARKSLSKAGAILTNVDDDILERAMTNPHATEKAIKTIQSNPDAPFAVTAKQVGDTLIKKFDDAKKAIGLAKETFEKNSPDMRFDVSASIDDISKVLKENNLGVLSEPGKKGAKKMVMNDVKLSMGPAKPLEDAELGMIEEYINTVTKAKNYTLNDVLDIKKLYGRIYKKLGENNLGTTSNAQRILAKLSKTVEKKVTAAMPDDLAKAYLEYGSAASAVDEFGQFVTTNSKGKLVHSDRGEGYLNTLWGMTKGQRREDMAELSKIMGYDVVENMRYLKDAQALSSAFPKTGSRSLDIIRGVLQQGALVTGAGAGFAVGGLPGAMLGGAAGATTLAATSPRLVGKGLINLSKGAQSGPVKGISKMINRLQPAEKLALYKIMSELFESDEGSTNKR